MKTIPKIVAIGGGEIREMETAAIDKRIIELTGKTQPKALFIPTASSDAPDILILLRRFTVGILDVKRARSNSFKIHQCLRRCPHWCWTLILSMWGVETPTR